MHDFAQTKGFDLGNDPEPLMGISSLMRTSPPKLPELLRSAAADPDEAQMFMRLSMTSLALGQREFGLQLQAKALAKRQVYRFGRAFGGAGIRLLAVMKPGDMQDNTPVDFLLEDSDVVLYVLYAAPGLPLPEALPDHDLVFVAAGESVERPDGLKHIARLLESWQRPVLNAPERIARLSRDHASRLLTPLPGGLMPPTVRLDRQALESLARDGPMLEVLRLPLLVRPVDSHAGEGLARVEAPAALADYLLTTPGVRFYVTNFIDYAGADGLYRKARVALIAGQPIVCHLAIADRWMVHYRSAGMAESPDKRAEEARFMEEFQEDFGKRHEAAFRAIAARTGLDYLVIDCGETRDGRLLVFELDNRGYVHAMDPPDLFPYKGPQMHKVFAAFRKMLADAIIAGAKTTTMPVCP